MEEKFDMKEATKQAVQKEKQEGKISYDDLNKIAQQLSVKSSQLEHENNYLKQQLQNNLSIVRLQMQFKVLEFSKHFEDKFIKETVKEIQEAMTIPEENNQPETTEEGK